MIEGVMAYLLASFCFTLAYVALRRGRPVAAVSAFVLAVIGVGVGVVAVVS